MLNEVYNMISDKKETEYTELISLLKDKSIVIYGAGGIGSSTYNIFKNKGYDILYFIDDSKEKQHTHIDGIKIFSLNDIKPDENIIILICTPNPLIIYHKLIGLGYKNIWYYPLMMIEKGFFDLNIIQKNLNAITKVYNMLADSFSKYVFCNILKHRITMDYSYFENIISYKQYFPTDLFSLNENECFVDGGVFNGDTIIDFINMANNSFKFIYGFEPDKANFENAKKRIDNIKSKNIRLHNSGLYSKTGEIGFNSLGNSGSCISETGNDKIFLLSLDEIIEKHTPTYIKLDIEGAEKEALLGMQKIIGKYHPKLAVSIYHKATHLWELPLIIHRLNPSYKIYIRHYYYGLNETVCYAL